MTAAFGENARIAAQIFGHRHRRPEVECKGKLRPDKIFRSHTNHLVRSIVESDRLADNVWIGGETFSPEVVTQHDDRIGANCLIFVRQKRSTEYRFDFK